MDCAKNFPDIIDLLNGIPKIPITDGNVVVATEKQQQPPQPIALLEHFLGLPQDSFSGHYFKQLLSEDTTIAQFALTKLENGDTVLQRAIYCKHLPVLTFLVENGANIESTDNKVQNTLLHLAIKKESVPIVEFLLKKGANRLATNKFGFTSLHQVALYQNAMISFNLLKTVDKSNDDISKHTEAVDLFNRTPLHLASASGSFHVVEDLLSFGANINALDKAGNTPLHYAVLEDMVSLLIRKGANRDAKNKVGEIPSIQEILNHPGHEHTLTLVENVHGDSGYSCSFCDQVGQGKCYYCFDCSACALHPHCSKQQ